MSAVTVLGTLMLVALLMTKTPAGPAPVTHTREPTRDPPGPRPRCSHHVIPETPSGSSAGTGQSEYGHLIPLQRRHADLAVDDPDRQQRREQLIRGYLPLAEHIAHRFTGRGEPLDDLIQVATIGLINVVDRFDPARGSHFLSFAVPTITGEIRRYFRNHGWSTRVPRRLKDLHLATRTTAAQLSQQLGRAPRPSEIAHQLGLPPSQVIDALHAGQA